MLGIVWQYVAACQMISMTLLVSVQMISSAVSQILRAHMECCQHLVLGHVVSVLCAV